jgi:SSS family transporter
MHSGFNWLDYIILVVYLMLVLFIATRFVKGQRNLNDFFMASRKMPWLAVGCSILASLLSAISITGIPAEYWENGLQQYGALLVIIVTVPITIVLFVKMYSRLNITTAYEYLEKRFSLVVRLMAGALFMLFRGSYLGIVIFASAVILQPAFGENVNTIWLIVGIGLCASALAVLGGMKAVIWTDVMQLTVVYGGILWMLISMITRIDGGFAGVWKIAVENGKDFSFLTKTEFWSFDLFEKTTAWGVLLQSMFLELASQGTDQLTVQRYLTTRSTKASARSLWSYACGASVVLTLLWIIGATLFAFYRQHPEQLAASVKPNGLLPYYIVTQMPHGISGLFVVAIIAAVLSVEASGMNCLATVIMNDFHLRLFTKNHGDAKNVFWARIWTVFWGFAVTGLSVVIYITARENLIRTTINILGLFSGPLLGVFLLGVLVRRANTRGVVIGAVLGVAINIWANFAWTKLNPDGQRIHISFTWPVVIGTLSTCLIGLTASLLFPRPTEDKLKNLTFWNT